MQLVAPLIAGNARTFLLAAVSSHPNSYLETVNTLRIATRAQKIQVNEEHISHTHTNHAHIVHCVLWGTGHEWRIVCNCLFYDLLSYFAMTLMLTNGCPLGHTCQVHSGGTCSKILPLNCSCKEALTIGRILTWALL